MLVEPSYVMCINTGDLRTHLTKSLSTLRSDAAAEGKKGQRGYTEASAYFSPLLLFRLLRNCALVAPFFLNLFFTRKYFFLEKWS